MNSFSLGGRLTRDTELRYTSQGLAVSSNSIAVNKPYSDGADFFNITAFGKKAELLAELGLKGRFINLHGYLKADKYTDKKGIDRRKYEVIVDWFSVVDWNDKGDKPKGGGIPTPEKVTDKYGNEYDLNIDDDDDLPF